VPGHFMVSPPPPTRCSWEGCTEERPYDPDWEVPADWGFVKWIEPGKTDYDPRSLAILCPEHFASFTLAMRLKRAP